MALSSFFFPALAFQVAYSATTIPPTNISAIAPGLPTLLLPNPVDVDAPLLSNPLGPKC